MPSIQTVSQIHDSKTSLGRIEQRITSMREAGFFDSVISSNQRAVTSMVNKEDLSNAQEFILHPQEYLQENIANVESSAEIRLIDLLLNQGTVGEVTDAMYVISPEMSKAYFTQIEALCSTSDNESNRSVSSTNDLRSIKLSFFDQASRGPERGIFANNFADDTCAWYTGMCAATLAGMCAWQYGFFPWIWIPGMCVTIAGAASMGVQLGVWATCPEFRDWVGLVGSTFISLVNKENVPQAKYLQIGNSRVGRNLVWITGATGSVIVGAKTACPVAFGVIASGVDSVWAAIAAFLSQAIPPGMSLKTFGLAFTFMF